jgi:outer membrane biosynthesis protein TonB
MRARPPLLFLTFAALLAHPAMVAGAKDFLTDPPQTDYNRYYTLVNDTLMRELVPELVRRSDLVDRGSLHMTFRVSRDGKISNIKITAAGRNQFAQQTAVRVIRSLRLPSIPKGVIGESGHAWMDIQIDLEIPAVKYQ